MLLFRKNAIFVHLLRSRRAKSIFEVQLEGMVRAWISGAQKCTIISLSSGAVSIVKVENNDEINADMLLEDY